LLRIAAGDDAAEREAARLTERPRPVIREAAAFYIEQVLLSPNANSYRVLGATPAATPQELRRHMALLLSWLHPDKNASGERAVLAARITGAWNDLRNPDRRAAYDAMLTRSSSTSDRRLRDPSRGLPSQKGASSQKSSSHNKTGRNSNGNAQNTKATNGKTKSGILVRAPSPRSRMGHNADLFTDERHSLLQRAWHSLKRLLRDRSIP